MWASHLVTGVLHKLVTESKCTKEFAFHALPTIISGVLDPQKHTEVLQCSDPRVKQTSLLTGPMRCAGPVSIQLPQLPLYCTTTQIPASPTENTAMLISHSLITTLKDGLPIATLLKRLFKIMCKCTKLKCIRILLRIKVYVTLALNPIPAHHLISNQLFVHCMERLLLIR